MLWVNYFCIVALLASVVAKYITPQGFWPLAFFGLGFPLLFILNCIWCIYWFAQFRIIGIWSLLTLVVSTGTLLSFVQINLFTKPVSNKDIKVMSYNSMLFDLYNWTKNKESRNIILTSLAEENPDIICFQEFYTSEELGDFNNIDTLSKLLTAKNFHVQYTTTLRQFDHWGIATFTKYPILKKGHIEFATRANNGCIYTDVLIGKDTVRIYNMHLQSIKFSKADYKFIDELSDSEKDSEDELEKGKTILRRLKKAFIRRAEQADVIALHIQTSPYKVIVCGDFNDTPASYVYRTIKGKLKDAFEESGNGFEQTYAGKFPRFRIDYILHSKEYTSKKYHHIESLTDHYPIITHLSKVN